MFKLALAQRRRHALRQLNVCHWSYICPICGCCRGSNQVTISRSARTACWRALIKVPLRNH